MWGLNPLTGMSTNVPHLQVPENVAAAYQSIGYRGPELRVQRLSFTTPRNSMHRWAIPAGLAAVLAIWVGLRTEPWDPDPERVHFSAVRTTVAFRVPERPAKDRWNMATVDPSALIVPQRAVNAWNSDPSRG